MGAVYRRALLALALSLLDIAFAFVGSAHVAVAMVYWVLVLDALRRAKRRPDEPAFWRRPTIAALVLVALSLVAFALSSSVVFPLGTFAVLAAAIAVSQDLRSASAQP